MTAPGESRREAVIVRWRVPARIRYDDAHAGSAHYLSGPARQPAGEERAGPRIVTGIRGRTTVA